MSTCGPAPGGAEGTRTPDPHTARSGRPVWSRLLQATTWGSTRALVLPFLCQYTADDVNFDVNHVASTFARDP